MRETKIGFSSDRVALDTAEALQGVQRALDGAVGELFVEREQPPAHDGGAGVPAAQVVGQGDEPHPEAKFKIRESGDLFAGKGALVDDPVRHGDILLVWIVFSRNKVP